MDEFCIKRSKICVFSKEVPIGAVIVYENEIIGKGYNQIELLKDPTLMQK